MGLYDSIKKVLSKVKEKHYTKDEIDNMIENGGSSNGNVIDSTSSVNNLINSVAFESLADKEFDDINYYTNNFKNTAEANVKAIAHRGYSSEAPENTEPAYRLARQKGFTYVECDVRFTSDGIPVLIHDTTIDRTSDGTGNVLDMTLATLNNRDFGSWKNSKYAGTKILTFENFIILCKKLNLKPYIELKTELTTEQATELIRIVKKYGMVKHITWISFIFNSLSTINTLLPKCRLGYLMDTLSTSGIDQTATLKTDYNEVFVDCGHTSLTSDLVDYLTSLDLTVEVYTIDDSTSLNNAVSLGVSGITTNKLNVAYELEKNEDYKKYIYCYDLNTGKPRYFASDIYSVEPSVLESKVLGNFAEIYSSKQKLNQYSLAKHDKYIYIFGGFVSDAQNSNDMVNSMCRFNCETKKLEYLYTYMPYPYAQGCSATVGDKIYIFGGLVSGTNLTLGCSNRIYKLTIVSDETIIIETIETTMPVGLGWTTCVAVETDIYIFGGNNNMVGDYQYAVNTIYKFDTLTETFTLCNATLNDKAYCCASAYVGNGKINIYGGQTNSNGHMNIIQQYDIEIDTITVLDIKLPYVLGACGICKVANKVFLVGGYSTGATNNIIEHNLDTNVVSVTNVTIPYSAYYTFCEAHDNFIYTFGGKRNINDYSQIELSYSGYDLAIEVTQDGVNFIKK